MSGIVLALTTASAQERVSIESFNEPGHYISHRSSFVYLSRVKSDSDRNDATFLMHPALNGSEGAVSFEAVNRPGHFLRHQELRLKLDQSNDTVPFKNASSFFIRPGLFSRTQGVSYEAATDARHYILTMFNSNDLRMVLMHYDGSAWIRRYATFRNVAPLTPTK
jgi:hypothetical protein